MTDTDRTASAFTILDAATRTLNDHQYRQIVRDGDPQLRDNRQADEIRTDLDTVLDALRTVITAAGVIADNAGADIAARYDAAAREDRDVIDALALSIGCDRRHRVGPELRWVADIITRVRPDPRADWGTCYWEIFQASRGPDANPEIVAALGLTPNTPDPDENEDDQ